MNYIHIHFDPSRNGEIVSWLTGAVLHDYSVSDQSHLRGCLVTTVEVAEGHTINIDPKTQRIDVETLELVSKHDDEITHALLPDEFEVKSAILRELEATDFFANPPPDMPRKGQLLLDWQTYRQALRDLSKLGGGPVAMVRAWPLRPDGSVPAGFARLSAGLSE